MVKIKMFLLALLLSLPTLCKADDSITVLDALKTLPLKEGVTYSIKDHRFLNTLGLGIIGYKGFGLDLAYIGIDGLGGTLNYNLGMLPVSIVPVNQFLKYLNVGYTVGWRTLALNPTTDNPKSDNKFIQGPTVYLKINF